MDKIPETQIVLKQLCDYFHLDYEDVTYVETVEIMYIYRYIAGTAEEDFARALEEIKKLHAQVRGRSKRRRLYELFNYCQSQRINHSGKYDTSTLRPPMQLVIPDNYY